MANVECYRAICQVFCVIHEYEIESNLWYAECVTENTIARPTSFNRHFAAHW
jgi:hypothetical protein